MPQGHGRGQEFFVTGGTLPLESASYVERASDRELFENLLAGRYCYVLNARQMGKSSLSVRTLSRLEASGVKVISLDLTQMGGRNVTPEQWYSGLAVEAGRILGIRSEALAYCRANSDFAPMHRFFGFLRDVVLTQFQGPIVVCLDEIDATMNLPFDCDEFFAGIRDCFNRRTREPIFERLTFCLIGVAVPSDLIRTATTTPFNIGTRIDVADFTLDEIQGFSKPFGDQGKDIVERVHYWTSGHPYLTQSVLAAVSQRRNPTKQDVDAVVQDLFFGPKSRERNPNLADVANRAVNAGANEPSPSKFRADLLSTYLRVLQRGKVSDDEGNRSTSLLKLSGLVRSEQGRLLPRNRIYSRVFDRRWVEDSMPAQELRRQRVSFRRGLLRAALYLGAVVVVMAWLAFSAVRAERKAVTAELALDRELYVSAMNNLRGFEQEADKPRIVEVLGKLKSSQHKGLEWNLWASRLHGSQEEYTLDYSDPSKREHGVLSFDGKLLCLYDELSNLAVIIDRKTQKVVATRPIPTPAVVNRKVYFLPSIAGFLMVAPNVDGYFAVSDLLSGRVLAPNDDPMFKVYSTQGSPEKLAILKSRSGAKHELEQYIDPKDVSSLVRVDVHTGKEDFSIPYGEVSSYEPNKMLLSGNGGRIAVAVPPRLKSESDFYSARVFDVGKRAEFDRFDFKLNYRMLDMNKNGTDSLFVTDSAIVGRSHTDHRIVFTKAWAHPEEVTKALFFENDQSVVVLDQNGHATVFAYPSGELIKTFTNVWDVSAAQNGPELVLSSDTVQIFNRVREDVSKYGPVGNLLNDGRGRIEIFTDLNPVDQRVGTVVLSDPDLGLVADLRTDASEKRAMFNGRWNAVEDRQGNYITFQDTFTQAPPIKISPLPRNFACGLAREYLVVANSLKQEQMVYTLMQGISGENGKKLWERKIGAEAVSGIWMSRDGTRIFAYGRAGSSVGIYDSATGEELGVVQIKRGAVRNILFNPNSKAFFTLTSSGEVDLWDPVTFKSVLNLNGSPGHQIKKAILTSDGKRVVTCTEGGEFEVWDVQTAERLTSLRVAPGPILTFVFTSDQKRILYVGPDSRVHSLEVTGIDSSIRYPLSPEAQARVQARKR